MSAAFALESARAVGVRVAIDGDNLALEATEQPPQAVLELLSQHKADILRLLRRANDGWSADDWQVFFDERAGIAEYDSGLPRAEAEARAFACCVTEWINRNPIPSAPGRCLACGGDLAIGCFRSAPILSATPGCIARVGRNGIGRERSRLSRHLLRWAFEHVGRLMSAKKQRREERAVPRLPSEGETVTDDDLRSITDGDAEAQLRDPVLWAYMLRDPTGAVCSHGHGRSRKECEMRAVAHAAECAEEAWPESRAWLPSKWRLLIWSPENSEKSCSPILLKSPLAKANLKRAKPRSLSKPQINALLVGIDLKLTRSSMGWSPDDGVTCFDGCFSPATISSLWERGLLDANFIDLRVIYGGRGLTDVKNFDGAHYADLPGMPKFQVWTSALGKKVLQDKGLFSKNVELRYH